MAGGGCESIKRKYKSAFGQNWATLGLYLVVHRSYMRLSASVSKTHMICSPLLPPIPATDGRRDVSGRHCGWYVQVGLASLSLCCAYRRHLLFTSPTQSVYAVSVLHSKCLPDAPNPTVQHDSDFEPPSCKNKAFIRQPGWLTSSTANYIHTHGILAYYNSSNMTIRLVHGREPTTRVFAISPMQICKVQALLL